MKFYSKFFIFTSVFISLNASISPNIFAANAQNGTENQEGERILKVRNLKVASGKRYMISTADELASKAAQNIIDQGGNALDAAIAAQMVLNVVEPYASGIGGGGFLLFHNAKINKSVYFNGHETSPNATFGNMFLDKNGKARSFEDVTQGGLSVATPGLLKMLKEAHEKYGRLPWAQLFEPAIEAAHKGFEINERLYWIITQTPYLKNFGEAGEIYLENGKPREIGTIVTNPKMAATLETIAQEGSESFYKGKIAQDIVNAVRNSKINPGNLNLKDLASYQVKSGDLLCSTYRIKYKVCSMPLPSYGGVSLLQILGILENFDLKDLKPNSKEAVHLIIEASRLANADRNEHMTDISNVPIDKMLDKLYLRQRSLLIKPNRIMTKVSAGKFASNNNSVINSALNKLGIAQHKEPASTTHISVVDDDGNAVSLTSSIENYFGSGLTVDGFFLNNELTDFAFTPVINNKYVVNRPQPNKQARSSLTPTFVFDQNDKLLMVVGSTGGPRIVPFVLKTIIGHLDWGLNIQEAISAPNFDFLNGFVELEEKTVIARIKPELEAMGHKVRVVDIVSGVNAVSLEKGRKIKGGSDPRRLGAAIGN